MNKAIIFAFMFLLVAFPHHAFSQSYDGEHAKRTIQVTGDAEVRVVPNEAVIAMSVVVRERDLLAGEKKVDESVGKVLELFKKLGIKPEHMQTDYVDVSPVFFNCNNGSYDKSAGICDPTKTDYYDLKKGILVRLSDLRKFEQVISNSLRNGVTYIENVQFVTTEMRKFRDQARDMAVKAAKEKAEAVAGALGQKVGKPLSISIINNSFYNGAYGYRNQNRSYNSMAQQISNTNGEVPGDTSNSENASTSFGQIKVDAQVSVTFQIE